MCALPLAMIFFRRGTDFVARLSGDFQRDSDAVLGEQLSGLKFMNVHFKN
jgi:hypothetical protein